MKQKNILEYLEDTVQKLPDQVAYTDGTKALTFQEVFDQAQAIGTYLHLHNHQNEPVVVFMKRSPESIAAFFGCVYAGCFYIPLDEEMPKARMELIIQNVSPRGLICDVNTKKALENYSYQGEVYCYEEIIETKVDQTALSAIRERQIDTDPIYIVFTSGSTGIPKGVTACHRSVIDYIEALSEILQASSKTIFGNQVPLYFDACLKELLCTIKHGGTTYLIPKSLFMFPIKLVEYLNQYQINTLCWVSSALTMISGLGVLKKMVPKYLHTVAFGSEVFPVKQFNLWREALLHARFINLYGPTECTGMSCYYVIDEVLDLEDTIPIGRPFPNRDVFLLGEDNQKVTNNEVGEICIRGTSLTLGYYKNFEKTTESFVQNPLNTCYPELIYKTGDLGRYNDRKDLVFVSRKDNQIKHMGHRIELGEIELHTNKVDGVSTSCCLYDQQKGKIVLCYMGQADKKQILFSLKEKLPRYMLPNKIISLERMPFMANGKIDRVHLKEEHIDNLENGGKN